MNQPITVTVLIDVERDGKTHTMSHELRFTDDALIRGSREYNSAGILAKGTTRALLVNLEQHLTAGED